MPGGVTAHAGIFAASASNNVNKIRNPKMFFADRICGIKPSDRVLEIGPGGTPHPRADILLERHFTEEMAAQQRGGMPALKTNKTIVFYDGGKFPFSDKEFDYVICSHVIEHVENIEEFLQEMFRVSKRGYIEYPTIYYEYLYNFSVHLQLVHFEQNELRYMPKSASGLSAFQPVQALFYRSLELGYANLIEDMKEQMFQGFEWEKPFAVRKVNSIAELTVNPANLPAMPCLLKIIRRGVHFFTRYLLRIKI
jgi:SAM-dependent methyltransferase